MGFRWFVCRHARALGLSGWVRNEPDGSVELEMQGEPASLDEMERLLRVGPRLAHVQDLEVRGVPPEEDTGFRVTY